MPPLTLPSPLLQPLSQATVMTPALRSVSKTIMTAAAPLMPKPNAQPPPAPLSPSIIETPLQPATKVSTIPPAVITTPLQPVPLRPLTLRVKVS